MWNNVYDVDKRYPAIVVKQKNPDYEYKKTIFIRNRQRSGLNNSVYPKLLLKKHYKLFITLVLFGLGKYPD